MTVSEYLEGKDEGIVYYTSDKDSQSYYLGLFTEKGKKVLLYNNIIDNSFAKYLESKNYKIKFRRIDSGFEESASGGNEKLTTLFKTAIGRENVEILFASLGINGAAALISLPEESRRFNEMMQMYSTDSFAMPMNEVLTINSDNTIIKINVLCKIL